MAAAKLAIPSRPALGDAAPVTGRPSVRSFRGAVMALLSLSAGPAIAGQSAAPANPCAGPEFHQFDFWAGQWDVYGPQGKQVANSLIEKVYGCGVRENWMPFGAAGGGSLNF